MSMRDHLFLQSEREEDSRKFDDQGDGRDEGGTCTMHEELLSRGAKGATTSGHGNVKGNRMIWLIGWKEWMEDKGRRVRK